MGSPIQVEFLDHVALSPELTKKYAHLQELIAAMGHVAVAYSGGIDSTLLARVAHDLLGDNMRAIMAVSESLGTSEREAALAILDNEGIPYELVYTQEVHDPRYAANPANRCYFCKVHVHDAILDEAERHGLTTILDGFNADDIGDHRPGRQAGRERGVRSPLHEADLHKADIRALARHLGLANWAKPAMACLSSRVPYGTAINPEILAQIDQAETALRTRGFQQLRVRHHGTLARIEVPVEDISEVITQRDTIVADLKAAGYIYVTLDLQGFRSGSVNEELIQSD